MDKKDCSYICNICNKKYASSNSLWNHNKKFHNTPVNTLVNNAVNTVNNMVNTVNSNNKSIQCENCTKIFKSKQAKYLHKKKYCPIILNQENNQQIILNPENNIDNKIITVNADTNIMSNSNNSNNINNINNGSIVNNYTINQVGCENIDKLTYDDIKKIFRQHKNCLYHAIDFVNFNENIPENHNFYNSSLEGKYINVFNVQTNSPEKKNKKDFFDKLLMSSLNIMNLLYEKVKDSVSPIKKKSLKKMINELDKIAHLDNHKKIYALNVNQISYNKKEIVKKSWSEKKKQDKNNLIEDYLSDTEYRDNLSDSDSDTESKDSFYYITEEENDEENEEQYDDED
jgi:hypothetical protein